MDQLNNTLRHLHKECTPINQYVIYDRKWLTVYHKHYDKIIYIYLKYVYERRRKVVVEVCHANHLKRKDEHNIAL